MDKETLVRVAQLGGHLKVNRKNLWMYGQDKNNNLTKERLYRARGPLHIGMPHGQEIAIEATQSDTKQTLIRELAEQTHMTRTEAESTVNELLKKGILEEINDPALGKVLVFKGRR
jgi:hypothetical protein